MGEAKFTPGPWVTKQAISADNVGGFDWCVTQVGDTKIIAEVFQRVGGVQGFWDDRPVEANAHLIAAAPNLYEALKAVISVADRKTVEFDLAHAALAKAEGRNG